jgi:8-oxo-dGTP pyrophosphatase MutT (NUDIX family)
MNDRQKPRQATTVILLRRRKSRGFEVFLTRRPEAMAFLGGIYCFPGGTVRKEDYSPAMLRRCYGLNPAHARKIVGAHFSPEEALGFWIAGIRELFEEVGILLSVDESRGQASADLTRENRLAETQAALLSKSVDFTSILRTQDLLCDASSLAYFSHWQTPSQQSIRFDTRFFLAALPEGQLPLSTSAEVTQSLWLTPDRALQLFANDELPIIFPTFASLRTLADFDSLESLFREYRLAKAIS